MEILLLFVVDCAWMLPFAVIVWLFVKFVMVKRSPLKVVWALFVRAPRVVEPEILRLFSFIKSFVVVMLWRLRVPLFWVGFTELFIVRSVIVIFGLRRLRSGSFCCLRRKCCCFRLWRYFRHRFFPHLLRGCSLNFQRK